MTDSIYVKNGRGRKLALQKTETMYIQQWLIRERRWRDLALFMVGIDSLLRAIDLLSLKYDDVVGFRGNIKSHLIHGQHKTKKTVECFLSEPTRQALAHWIKISGKNQGDYLFTRLRKRSDCPVNTPITRSNLALIIKQCVSAIGLDPSRYSTRTLRKSRIRPILEMADYDYQIPQLLLGHADIRSTVHYCGVAEEKALAISKAVQFFDPISFSDKPQEPPDA